jgi:predicted transcriptional regulator
MEILHHVWELGSASVADIRERISAERDIAYTTVMTVMRNLAGKGYLSFTKEGASFVYQPLRRPDEVRRSLVNDLVSKVFRGSPLALVQSLVGSESLSDEERDQISQLISRMEDKHGDS